MIDRLRRGAAEAKARAPDHEKEHLDCVEKEEIALLDRLAGPRRPDGGHRVGRRASGARARTGMV